MDIVKSDYGINNVTIAPAIYGRHPTQQPYNLKYDRESDILLLDTKDKYHHNIYHEISEYINRRGAVIVYFESENKIEEFLQSEYGLRLKSCNASALYKVTEKTKNVNFCVNKATHSGTVSLFTKSFGRGWDFICEEREVDDAGGVFVIQTFFSDYISEEIQIMGRTARQNKKGIYKMILFAGDLIGESKGLNVTEAELNHEAPPKKTFYEFLNCKRMAAVSTRIASLRSIASQASQMHTTSNNFLKSLRTSQSNLTQIINSIISFGGSGGSGRDSLHLVFCLDDSTSMKSYWQGVVQAYTAFLNIRREKVGNGDIVSVIQFSNSASVTVDRITLTEALGNTDLLVHRGGGTMYIPPLNSAHSQIACIPEMNPAVIFMTDGMSTDQAAAVTSARNLATQFGNNLRFFGIAFHAKTGGGLLELTNAAGGVMVEAANVTELSSKFTEIANTVSVSYGRGN